MVVSIGALPSPQSLESATASTNQGGTSIALATFHTDAAAMGAPPSHFDTVP